MQKLWTPDGVKDIGGEGAKTLQRVELRASMGEWFRQMADFAAAQDTGIHCARCGADIVGRNGASDAAFSVACGCREWIFSNREYVKPIFQ